MFRHSTLEAYSLESQLCNTNNDRSCKLLIIGHIHFILAVSVCLAYVMLVTYNSDFSEEPQWHTKCLSHTESLEYHLQHIVQSFAAPDDLPPFLAMIKEMGETCISRITALFLSSQFESFTELECKRSLDAVLRVVFIYTSRFEEVVLDHHIDIPVRQSLIAFKICHPHREVMQYSKYLFQSAIIHEASIGRSHNLVQM